jgi:hypothetical protein
MNWVHENYENFTDFADEDRISALLLCEVLNLNFEYFCNFDKQTGYVGEWARNQIYVYPSVKDLALACLHTVIDNVDARVPGNYRNISFVENYIDLDAFGHRLLEEFGASYAQLLPNGKVVKTDYGW